MDEHTEQVLDYRAFLERIAAYAQTEPGRAWILNRRPQPQPQAAESARGLIPELQNALQQGAAVPELRFGDIRPILDRARPQGAVLPTGELAQIRRLLEAADSAQRFLAASACRPLERLQARRPEIIPPAELHRALEQALDPDGALRDDASPQLRTLTREIRTITARIHARLEQMFRNPETAAACREHYVTLRNDRHVVPVRREAKARIPGVVHDHSDSGRTLFVEPAATLPLGNELAEARAARRDECRRILAQLSNQVRAVLPRLRRIFDHLAELDGAAGIAAWARDYDAAFPRFGNELVLRTARHPLLEARFRRENNGRRVVPLDLWLPEGARTLVITGSNSGGKTVALKTTGLLCLAAQAGLPIPADPAGTLPVFAQILADIGEEQSLQQDLSTFSGHVARIARILETARNEPRPTLVLLDELGAGTDPLEGGALACAVLRELASTGALTLATTHLGVVKTMVQEHPHMVNAAVCFDSKTLAPEYRLEIGRPGASHALAVAARAGMPENVLAMARNILNDDHLRLEQVLVQLEEQQQRAARRERKLRENLERITQGRHELEQELTTLRAERRRMLHEAYLQAQRTVERTRREMERLLREFQRSAQTPIEETTRAKLQKARDKLLEKQRKLRAGARRTRPRPLQPLPPEEIRPGRRVWVETMQTHAVVQAADPRRKRAWVEANGLRLQAPFDQLGAPKPEPDRDETAPKPPPATTNIPARTVPAELNLIGLRVDEAIPKLEAYLSDALLARLPEARIIHGFGAGRLRRAVHEFLAAAPGIREFRLGAENDPGRAGATWVKFDRD